MGDGEKRRDLGSVASLGKARLTGIRFSQVQPRESIQVPNVDVRETLHPFKFRHSEDEDGNTYRRETQLELYLSEHKHIPHDEVDVSSKHPSYTNFKIPYNMVCAQRYVESRKTYEAQLEHEIKQMIDFQRSAADACYFVRCMAYTTFWPPLHNMTEVRHTGKHFFRLTHKEKSRFLQIMNTDIT